MIKTYVITEAAKILGVESHVLRYWERELNLDISRSNQGYRYYTELDIHLFQCIKKLKDQGLTLKELKPFIPELLQIRTSRSKTTTPSTNDPSSDSGTLTLQQQMEYLEQIRSYIRDTLQEVVSGNNKTLTGDLSDTLLPQIKTEIKYLTQAVERQEEDHYRRLDKMIRQHQQANQRRDLTDFFRHGRQILMDRLY